MVVLPGIVRWGKPVGGGGLKVVEWGEGGGHRLIQYNVVPFLDDKK